MSFSGLLQEYFPFIFLNIFYQFHDVPRFHRYMLAPENFTSYLPLLLTQFMSPQLQQQNKNICLSKPFLRARKQSYCEVYTQGQMSSRSLCPQ